MPSLLTRDETRINHHLLFDDLQRVNLIRDNPVSSASRRHDCASCLGALVGGHQAGLAKIFLKETRKAGISIAEADLAVGGMVTAF